jgi:ATP-binding cassette subfamily B protein
MVPLARRLASYLRPYRRALALTALCSAVEAGLMVIPLLELKVMINRLRVAHPHVGGLILPLIAVVGSSMAAAIVGVASTYLLEKISEGIVRDLREQIFDNLIDQSAEFYGRRRGGEVISGILNDVGAIDSLLAGTALSLLRYLLSAGTVIVVMIVLNWQLAVLVMILIPATVIPVRRASRKIGAARLKVQELLANLTAYLHEVLGVSGAQLVRAYARADDERRRFSELNTSLRRQEIAAAMSARWFGASLSMISTAGPALLILCGGYLAEHDGLSLGTVLVFAVVLSGRMGVAVQGLAGTVTSLISSVPIWRRIFEMLDERPEIVERSDALRLAPEDVRGAIEFDRVRFTYPGQTRPAIRDLSLRIAPGELVALVGPTGAGKTTFGGLVSRLIDPQSGAVRLDGHDLRDLTLDTVALATGIVFQDTFIFHNSLAENLRYGRPTATEEEIWSAIRDARLEEVVSSLPAGLQTVVGERGHRLSGGEKQRLAIARVVLKNPRILILDEATSHLDRIVEEEVQQALERLFEGRTTIVIAHRLSTVRNADTILVMDRGEIVESGTHDELIASGGLFSRLYAAQAPAAIES